MGANCCGSESRKDANTESQEVLTDVKLHKGEDKDNKAKKDTDKKDKDDKSPVQTEEVEDHQASEEKQESDHEKKNNKEEDDKADKDKEDQEETVQPAQSQQQQSHAPQTTDMALGRPADETVSSDSSHEVDDDRMLSITKKQKYFNSKKQLVKFMRKSLEKVQDFNQIDTSGNSYDLSSCEYIAELIRD